MADNYNYNNYGNNYDYSQPQGMDAAGPYGVPNQQPYGQAPSAPAYETVNYGQYNTQQETPYYAAAPFERSDSGYSQPLPAAVPMPPAPQFQPQPQAQPPMPMQQSAVPPPPVFSGAPKPGDKDPRQARKLQVHRIVRIMTFIMCGVFNFLLVPLSLALILVPGLLFGFYFNVLWLVGIFEIALSITLLVFVLVSMPREMKRRPRPLTSLSIGLNIFDIVEGVLCITSFPILMLFGAMLR
ncbi:hypothetical protein J8273_4128 [Carpediemonas membranifera]|uniref:Uncharacterized protein n=1 Tax=Carpediemonas membranifera TaxID=201153 RepID=A0A8J6E2A8_9EUKA|nr:hypothetical protein J8273_4128 [Carpediemonas membranifera]|eukprot:KAG9394463.1 hypothetical protein J8273_4128 [Carpediemonas membranifera]